MMIHHQVHGKHTISTHLARQSCSLFLFSIFVKLNVNATVTMSVCGVSRVQGYFFLCVSYLAPSCWHRYTSKSHNGTILLVLILCAGNLINFSCSAVTCHCRIGSRNVWVTEFDQISHINLELSLCFVFGQNACNMLLLYLLLYFLFLLVVSL